MSVLGDFYTVNSINRTSDTDHRVEISINPDHQIFEGHFPDNPVTPGVCMLQIIKDLTENITAQTLTLQSASNVKFMAIINPNINPDLMLDVTITDTGDLIKVKASASFEETLALKMSAVYTKNK